MNLRALLGDIALVSCLVGSAVVAQAEQTPLPSLRFEEHHDCPRSGQPQPETLDRLKCLAVDRDSGRQLSLGAEARLRYEFVRNAGFGAAARDSQHVLLQRYVLLADWHLISGVRVFGQLNSALEDGRSVRPLVLDENRLEIQNLFLDWKIALDDRRTGLIRIGRQELLFGSGRLVDVREGPNVRRTFDGVRFDLAPSTGLLSLFAVRPRQDETGAFDDDSSDTLGLWGLYATWPEQLWQGARLDLYYLGFEDETAFFVQGTAEEQRHTLGTRLSGRRDAWDFNWELLYQFGRFGAGDIVAWTLATDTGYTWRSIAWQPRLALNVNVASGDRDPGDADLETLNPLFPRGNYFDEVGLLGPRNFYNAHIFLTSRPTRNWTLGADVDLFWRLETTDGVYTPGGQLIRAPLGSSAHRVATVLTLKSEWAVSRHASLTVLYTHLEPGAFLRETGPAESIDFIQLSAQFRF